MPYIVTFFVLCTFLISCDTRSRIVQTATQVQKSKTDFFNEAQIFFDDSKLRKEIQKNDISEREIVDFCKKNNDPALKTKFAAAVYSNKSYNKKPANEKFWAAIRFNLGRFVETVMLVKEPAQKTFMDIGSGNGEKLFTALCIGFEKVYGLEYSQESFEESQENLKDFPKEIEITKGDALAIEGDYFKKADFYICIRPLKMMNWQQNFSKE